MKELILVRGGGDLASGVIQKLHRSGFNVVVLEIEKPSFIRRKVCYGNAIFEGEIELEGCRAVYVGNLNSNKNEDNKENEKNIFKILEKNFEDNKIPIIIDEKMNIIEIIKKDYHSQYRVEVIVDAIIAKKNLGMKKELAPITIALGPGFEAGEDAHIVIETMRGHNLGKLLFKGEALANTGVPGMIGGESKLRVIYSENQGIIEIIRDIGDIVKKDEIIAKIGNKDVCSTIDGLIRGMITNGYYVKKGLKIADVDPRISEYDNCFTISDKARSLGGAVLEAILYLKNKM